jgi:HEAT repeat protein
MPKHKLPSLTTPLLIAGALFVSAAAVGAAVYGVEGTVAVVTLACLSLVVTYDRWARWAVAPEKETDLATARAQLEKLHHPRRSVRWRAANVLRAVGPDCAPIVSELVGLLGHSDPIVRAHVCQALGSIGPGAKEAVPTLLELLKERPYPAVFALTGIGPDAKAAVPLLIEHMRAGTGNCETFVAIALWKIEQNAELAVPALLDVLQDESAPLRRAAVDALSRIGPPAEAAKPALMRALKDQDRWVRNSAAEALEKIAPTASSGRA